jgi:hypothetical protein
MYCYQLKIGKVIKRKLALAFEKHKLEVYDSQPVDRVSPGQWFHNSRDAVNRRNMHLFYRKCLKSSKDISTKKKDWESLQGI